MKKEELLKSFEADFKKSQGALVEVLSHNREIDALIVNDLMSGDYTRLEEHIEISKIIMDGVKGFNELYKNTPIVLDNVSKLPEKKTGKGKLSLKEAMEILPE